MVNNILYIVPLELGSNSSKGVVKKIRQQTAQWQLNNRFVTVIYISNSVPTYNLLDNESWISSHVPGKNFPSVYLNRIYSTFEISKLIQEIKPELIYVRYSLYWPFSGLLYKTIKTVVEMNTNDLVEYKKSSNVFNFVYNKLRSYYFTTKNAAICVSPEILNTLSNTKIPSICLPNGADFSGEVKAVTYSDEKPRKKRVVFISSPNQPWQGVDKILLLADIYVEYHFDIIGWDQGDYEDKINVTFHGYLSESDFKSIMHSASYAIGPLALHRKSMNSTSALKTSLYLQYNLPILQSYEEVGLVNDAILVIENKEKNINDSSIKEINAFFEYWKTKNVDLDEVKKLVGIEKIEEERVKFFDSVYSGHYELIESMS